MRRPIKCLLALATLSSPLIAAFNTALFEYLTDYLISKQWDPLNARLVASFGITFIVMVLFFSIGWAGWWRYDSLICKRVRDFYWDHVESLKYVLEGYRDEINNEIGIYTKSKEPKTERWQSLKMTFDTLLGGDKVFKTDIKIEKYLGRNIKELALVKELRVPVKTGLKRVRDILGKGEKKIDAIHRAEELVRDVIEHVEQLQVHLLKL